MSQNIHDDKLLPLVTVITVTRNIFQAGRQRTFEECLESVHKQDYPYVEHLIIDGASDDGTLEFLSKYEADGWITCYSEPDDGIYDAMNKGINRARGKYVAFLNSDDCWYEPTGISRSVKLLEEAQADFSYAPRRIINEDGSHMAYEEASLAVLFTRYPFCHQTMFTRTDLLLKLNGFAYKKYKITADYDLLTRLLIGGAKAVFVPHCFTAFRLGGFSASADIVYQEYTSILKEYYGKYVENFDEHEVKKGIVPTYLMVVLRSIFHPSVMGELDMYSIRQGKVTLVPNVLHRSPDLQLGEPTVCRCLSHHRQSVGTSGNLTARYKFAGIPLVRIDYKENVKIVRLLGVPLLHFLIKDDSYKVKLFNLLPVFTCKKRLS